MAGWSDPAASWCPLATYSAEKIRAVIDNVELYVEHSDNARTRVEVQMHDVWSFGVGAGAYSATAHHEYSHTQHAPELDWQLGSPLGETQGRRAHVAGIRRRLRGAEPQR